MQVALLSGLAATTYGFHLDVPHTIAMAGAVWGVTLVDQVRSSDSACQLMVTQPCCQACILKTQRSTCSS